MFGTEYQKNLVHRYGGPSNWSQSLNTAAIGAGLASIKLHHTTELATLQHKLQENIKLFDSLIPTQQFGSFAAIRLVHCGDAVLATKVATYLADKGFFTSAVFFPVVAQGKAAIRITLRADMDPTCIMKFCTLITNFLHPQDINTEIQNQTLTPTI